MSSLLQQPQGEVLEKGKESAVSRTSAASAANRGEMKSIIESIRREREENIRGQERCGKSLEQTSNKSKPLHHRSNKKASHPTENRN